MAKNWQSRTALLLGDDALQKLAQSHVLVIGLGGVGAHAAEQLARAGVGKLTLVDGDRIEATNRNRQLLALSSSEGETKTKLMAARLRDINPDIQIEVVQEYIKDDKIIKLLDQHYDYIIDAIDSLSSKVFVLYQALQKGFRIVSSMGAGGKIDPLKIQIVDISKTQHCRLAFYIRKRLHKLGVREGFTAVYSPEPVAKSSIEKSTSDLSKRSIVGTISYMPAIFGCYCASVVIRELIS
ncbi:MAG: tRNA threonylcarbamoyladenosine dehydratase [Bacteroidetes bacterium]|nr:tRNA threonylcarbamoyladenosine dehydratase [Bacteroidota bacterium]MBU1578682.1 tRNA threonylcarbamoyladenosine dehydratase [Bacteroidota bacterium]MBU2464863.1 tRNA threonylcarbamoyladenosine dehydratase [Bacteroidota bacterium]MBU2558424.1 tRNA threonylcarbamoyladenosine dehydratase [Bacteroidota bacterium]